MPPHSPTPQTPPILTMLRALVFVQTNKVRCSKKISIDPPPRTRNLSSPARRSAMMPPRVRWPEVQTCAGGWTDTPTVGIRPHKLVRVVPRQRENVGEPRAGMQSGEGSGQVPRRRGGECRILYSTETGAFRLALRSFFLSLVHRTQGNTSRILMRLTLLG